MLAPILSIILLVVFVLMTIAGMNDPTPVVQRELPMTVVLGGPGAFLIVLLASIVDFRR